MFKKKSNKDELQILKEEFAEYRKDQRKEMEKLKKYFESRLFEFKHPVGLVKKKIIYGYILLCDYNKKNVVYEYATFDCIKEIDLTNLDEDLKSYKIYKQDNITYIGIRSESYENYFLLDEEKELVIEIKNSKLEEMDKMDWTNIA